MNEQSHVDSLHREPSVLLSANFIYFANFSHRGQCSLLHYQTNGTTGNGHHSYRNASVHYDIIAIQKCDIQFGSFDEAMSIQTRQNLSGDRAAFCHKRTHAVLKKGTVHLFTTSCFIFHSSAAQKRLTIAYNDFQP